MNCLFQFLLPGLRSFKILYFYISDSIRFAKYSNSVFVNSSKRQMIANIIYQYHTIEKGLVMPNRRWNFGHSKIFSLIGDCNRFIDKHGEDNDDLKRAVGVLWIYLEEHIKHNISVPDSVVIPIKELCNRMNGVEPVQQKSLSNKEYFAESDSSFNKFAHSRASVRNYVKKAIPVKKIYKAVEMSKSAPSACNRQATRVYVIQEREKIDQVLSYQNGNKGFGHLADKLLILTTEIASFRGAAERNFGWMDCGIFAMNLMYSLHYLQVGCCPLNAGLSPSQEKKIRKLCKIPPEEIVCLFMTCGNVPDHIELTRSARKITEDIIRLR